MCLNVFIGNIEMRVVIKIFLIPANVFVEGISYLLSKRNLKPIPIIIKVQHLQNIFLAID